MNKQDWLMHFEQQKQSGLNIRSYIRKNGLCEQSWYKKRRQLVGPSLPLKPQKLIEPTVITEETLSIDIRFHSGHQLNINTTASKSVKLLADLIREIVR